MATAMKRIHIGDDRRTPCPCQSMLSAAMVMQPAILVGCPSGSCSQAIGIARRRMRKKVVNLTFIRLISRVGSHTIDRILTGEIMLRPANGYVDELPLLYDHVPLYEARRDVQFY